jgi:hypothetical protein
VAEWLKAPVLKNPTPLFVLVCSNHLPSEKSAICRRDLGISCGSVLPDTEQFASKRASKHGGKMTKDLDARLRRFALQIAVQLPEDKKEALRVLGYMRELIDWQDDSVAKPAPHIVSLS